MEKAREKPNRLTADRTETWIEYGKEEGENWIKDIANDDALRVAVNAFSFDDAEEGLNRQDDYQYDYFKHNFRYTFQKILATENGIDTCNWDCEEYQLFKQGWMKAVKKFEDDVKRNG